MKNGDSWGREMNHEMNDEQDYICPICLELLLRPVVLSCEITVSAAGPVC